jgi:hypothetical protein
MINTNSGFCEHEKRNSGDKIRRNSFMPEKAQVTQYGRCSMKLVTQAAKDGLFVMPQTCALYVVYCKNMENLNIKYMLIFDVL